MADAVVEFLLTNLKELLLYHKDLIYGLNDEVESLHRELSLMKAFLKDSREKRNEFEYVREIVRQITDVAYEAEDIIDTFVVNVAMQKSRSGLNKLLHPFDHASLLRNVAKEIESIRLKVKEIYDKKMFGIVSMPGGEPSRRITREKRPPLVEEASNVVGFDEEAKTLIDRLTKGPKHLEAVTVVGMGGLGKTTLARKVYLDPRIEYHFYLRAWIYLSQEYSRREVFCGILESLGLMETHMSQMSDDRLAEELYRNLRDHSYLIVIDDVWTKEAWDDIRMAFPSTNLGSRILLTSRNREVALHANPDSPHNLRFLTDDESWELLCRKTFRKERCPRDLEELGKQIARKCDGLPLAIVVISGLLLKREKTHDWWRRVSDSVSTFVAKDPKQCMDVLALSYRHLPDHLKVCFVYFGVFPEDCEIPVWKLLRLWVAEGFVQENGQEWLEDLAEDYLEDLVDRNLVLVAKKRANGRIKSCRIHDMLRDLCIKEGAEQKFLHVIKGAGHNRPFSTPIQSRYNHRRLCIQSNVLDFIASKPAGPHVRSFLCFDSEEKTVPRKNTSFIQEAFELVRVLDLRPVIFPRFPSEITHLVHLRFITLVGDFKILPSSISNLWNLQTIIVRTTCRELQIKADIWKMLQLRHLHTSGISLLDGPPAQTRKNYEDPFVRRNILTISTISPGSCTENILARTPNLRKLGVCGKLITLMASTAFDNLAKLEHLESLKLLNDAFPLSPSQCTISSLPQSYKFPPNLKKLTLSDTLLEWDQMSTLGVLPNLEVLKLKDNAFRGSHWEPLDGGFRLLRVLQIGKCDLMSWDAEGHHFPRLENLVLRLCSKLETIPAGLAEVSGLKNIELYWPSRTAASSARSIQRRKTRMQQEMGMVSSAFKLLVYPPDV